MAMTEKYSFYGVTDDFEKELLFTCEKDKRDEAKQLIPPLKRDYLFIISDFEYYIYPFDNESLNAYWYHNYEILNFDLNKKFQILNGYRITPSINQRWKQSMNNKYVQYEFEDTSNGKKHIFNMSNYGDIDKVIDSLRLINTYGLTPEVMERLNDFK